MNFKNFSFLTTFGIGLCLTTINPVSAETFSNKTSSEFDLLISQLEGHDKWDAGQQIGWENYSLGRVIGKSGDILFIKTEEGAVFHATGTFCPGSDVLVYKGENGRFSLVDKAHSQWISRLKADYGWKQVQASSGNLNERTAAIWAEMEKSSVTTREIPPREVTAPPATTYTTETQVEQYNQPIRGLW